MGKTEVQKVFVRRKWHCKKHSNDPEDKPK